MCESFWTPPPRAIGVQDAIAGSTKCAKRGTSAGKTPGRIVNYWHPYGLAEPSRGCAFYQIQRPCFRIEGRGHRYQHRTHMRRHAIQSKPDSNTAKSNAHATNGHLEKAG